MALSENPSVRKRQQAAIKYKLVKAHHPTAYEDDVYAVLFVEKRKPKIDKYTRFYQVRANNKTEAVKKARAQL